MTLASLSTLYFVADSTGKSLSVATMPHGTADRSFAELVASTITGASIVSVSVGSR